MRGVRITQGTGCVLGASLLLGCAVGSGSDSPFGPAVSVGDGTATTGTSNDEAEDGEDESQGEGDGSATSIGEPPDDDGPPPPPPGSEICNGFDDDGDGQIDEDQPDLNCGIGACAVTQPSCVGGESQVCTPDPPGSESCNGVDDDCNGSVDDGAEQACSTACGNGVIACVGGVEQACDAPPVIAETCNLDDDDCDGSFDEGVGGCRIGVHRSYSPASGEHFYTTDLAEAQCCGFNLEVSDFYDLYAGPQPGLTGFYRCIKASGHHFYTQSANCEGQTVEFIMGYIATSANVAGSVPLYRMYRPASDDHFYTPSVAERNNAVLNLGYIDEGTAGYVW